MCIFFFCSFTPEEVNTSAEISPVRGLQHVISLCLMYMLIHPEMCSVLKKKLYLEVQGIQEESYLVLKKQSLVATHLQADSHTTRVNLAFTVQSCVSMI